MKIYNPSGFSSKLTGSFSGSFVGDGSNITSISSDNIEFNFTALSSSAQIADDISGSFTSLSSSIASDRLKNTTDTLTGDLTVTGTLTAQDLHVQEITSSIVYSSGSNIFGNQSSDIQQITGSLYLAEGEVGINATANYFSEKLFIGGLTRTLGLHVAEGIGNSNYGLITHNDDLLKISTDSSRVSGTGHIILSPYGNLGVGTTSPEFELDVTGSMRTTAFLVVSGSDTQPADIIPFNKPSGSSVNIGTYISSYGFIDISSTHNDGGWIDFSDGSGIDYRGRIRYYNNVDTFKIFTGQSGASTMEISSANKVSIGGASTDGYLEIRQTNNTPSIRLNNGSNPSGAYYDLISYTNGYLYLYRNGSTVSVLSDSNGNMGIGTSAPTQPLTVDGGATAVNQGIPATSGTSQNGILRLTSGDATYGETLDFGMNVATTYGWIQATNRDSLAVNYNLALNPNGGNVGIGTSSPDALLQLYTANQKVFELVSTDADGPYAAYKNTSTTLGFIGNAQGITNA